jgi:DNA-binding MarR family transcriptional regulator
VSKKTDPLATIENRVLEIINLLMGIHSGIRQKRKEGGMPDIPAYQLKAIAAFRSKTKNTVGALSTNAFVNKSSMSEMLKRLEKAGLVRRMRNPHNQREVQVSLTDQGSALEKKISHTRSRELQRTFGTLNTRDQTDLIEALTTAADIIRKAIKFEKMLL